MYRRIFFDGGDRTSKTTSAELLVNELNKCHNTKANLIRLDQIWEQNKGFLSERCEVWRGFLGRPSLIDKYKENVFDVFDRSILIDIVLNGDNSKAIKDGWLTGVIGQEDIVFLSTNFKYSSYRANCLRAKKKGMKVDKFDMLSEEEFYEFQNAVSRVAQDHGIPFIPFGENLFNTDSLILELTKI